jgi:hypothetical protein
MKHSLEVFDETPSATTAPVALVAPGSESSTTPVSETSTTLPGSEPGSETPEQAWKRIKTNIWWDNHIKTELRIQLDNFDRDNIPDTRHDEFVQHEFMPSLNLHHDFNEAQMLQELDDFEKKLNSTDRWYLVWPEYDINIFFTKKEEVIAKILQISTTFEDAALLRQNVTVYAIAKPTPLVAEQCLIKHSFFQTRRVDELMCNFPVSWRLPKPPNRVRFTNTPKLEYEDETEYFYNLHEYRVRAEFHVLTAARLPRVSVMLRQQHVHRFQCEWMRDAAATLLENDAFLAKYMLAVPGTTQNLNNDLGETAAFLKLLHKEAMKRFAEWPGLVDKKTANLPSV